MKKHAFRTELRELVATQRRIAVVAEIASKRGLTRDDTARDASSNPVQSDPR